MKKIITAFSAILVSGAVFAAPLSSAPTPTLISSTPEGMFKHQAFLYEQKIQKSGAAPDTSIYIIDLWGGNKTFDQSLEAYHEMGREYGYLLNKTNLQPEYQDRLSLDSFYTELHKHITQPQEWYLGWLYKDVTKVSYDRIPAREMAMIEGAAETTDLTDESATGGPSKKDKLIFLDQMFLFTFLSHIIDPKPMGLQSKIMHTPINFQNIPEEGVEPFGCSTLVTWGNYTTDGKMIFGRNFDWAKSIHSYFANRLLIGIFHPNNGDNSIALIGYPGWFFSDTAINDKGLLLEMNSGWDSSYTMNLLSPKITHLFSIQGTQAYADLMSDFLFTKNDYASLKQIVNDSTADISYIIIGTDGANTTSEADNHIFAAEEIAEGLLGQTFSPSHIIMRTPYTASAKPYQDIDPVKQDILVVSNSFRAAGWEKYQHFPFLPYNPYLTKDDPTSYPLTRYGNLLNQAKANHGRINIDIMKNIWERSLMQNNEGGATGYEKSPSLESSKAVTYFSLVAAMEEDKDGHEKLFNWWLRLPAVENQCVQGSICDDNLGWVNVDLNYFFK